MFNPAAAIFFVIMKRIFSFSVIYHSLPSFIKLLLHFCNKRNNFQCHVNLFLFFSTELPLYFSDKESNFQCHVNHSLFCLIQLLLHFYNKETFSVMLAIRDCFQSSCTYTFVIKKPIFVVVLSISHFIQSNCYYFFTIKKIIFIIMHCSLFSFIQLLLDFCDKQTNFQCHVDYSFFMNPAAITFSQ